MPPHQVQKVHQHIRQALTLQRANKLDAADKEYRAALQIAPKHPDALHFRGLLLHQKGKLSEAIASIEKAVAVAPGLAVAWNNLGNLYAMAGSLEKAVWCFRTCLSTNPDAYDTRLNLVFVLDRAEKWAEMLQEAREVLRRDDSDPELHRLHAKALRMVGQHEASVKALKEVLRRAPNDAPAKQALGRGYFLWYDQIDQDLEKARAVLTEWLAFDKDDPIAKHMYAALSGKGVPERADDKYISRHFDEFADTFDKVLDSLEYRGPLLLRTMFEKIDTNPSASLDVLDIGCGTGKCGDEFRPWARAMTGVDLSEKMLAIARERSRYDALERAEITAFLKDVREAFDLVICADTAIYFGDLSTLFARIAQALRPSGRLLCTVELLENPRPDETYRLGIAGRYAHSRAGIEQTLAAIGLRIDSMTAGFLRKEHGANIEALVFCAQKASETTPPSP